MLKERVLERQTEEDKNKVSIEALEFDWVFMNNNPENMINLLSNL